MTEAMERARRFAATDYNAGCEYRRELRRRNELKPPTLDQLPSLLQQALEHRDDDLLDYCMSAVSTLELAQHVMRQAEVIDNRWETRWLRDTLAYCLPNFPGPFDHDPELLLIPLAGEILSFDRTRFLLVDTFEIVPRRDFRRNSIEVATLLFRPPPLSDEDLQNNVILVDYRKAEWRHVRWTDAGSLDDLVSAQAYGTLAGQGLETRPLEESAVLAVIS